MSNLVKDIQPHLSHNENLHLAEAYSERYLLESCRSLEELEVQVVREGRLPITAPSSRASGNEEGASPLLEDHIFDEELVSQAGDRLQGDVSLKSNTIMLDTLVKGQGHRTRAPPPPKRCAPALPPLVSNKKP